MSRMQLTVPWATWTDGPDKEMQPTKMLHSISLETWKVLDWKSSRNGSHMIR